MNIMLLIILIVLVVALLVLNFTGKKSVHHEIMIAASPEKIWSVLMDTGSYPDWNPVMKLIDGDLEEGANVKYQFTQDADNISEIPSRVKRVIVNELLNQGGGLPFILTFDHRYIIERSGQGTKLTIHEDYNGIGVNFWNTTPVQLAYERLNEAIKNRVENS